jgi:phenylpropionate dioxygenase-like ring-hydroxylating dioxygenase large terminal subunit
MIDFFQVLPLGLDRSLIRYGVYGLPDDSREVRLMRKLNIRINALVNAEDRDLCLRVQQGLRTADYAPGPLAQGEVGVSQFHDYVRTRLPEVDDLAPAGHAPAPRPVALGAAE